MIAFPWGPLADKLAYLATPYSKYPLGIDRAFADAARLAARLVRAGARIYSPIVHTHPIAVTGHIDPLDHAIWLPFDEMMMRKCDLLIVAHMTGWDASRGIAYEIEFFTRARKPIFDLNPETFTFMRRRAGQPWAWDDVAREQVSP